METSGAKVTILSLPTAASAVEDLRDGCGGVWADRGAGARVAGSGGPPGPPSAVVVAGSGDRPAPPSAVVVAGPDAAAVGELVAAFRSAGLPAAGWVGDPSDPAVREMAAELFPGHEVVVGPH